MGVLAHEQNESVTTTFAVCNGKDGKTHLPTNGGEGWSGLPDRYRSPTEI